MTSQQPNPDNSWQWRDDLWADNPTTPSSPEQVPEDDDGQWAGWPSYLQRLMRWASR